MQWLSDETLAHLRCVVDVPDLPGDRYRVIEPIGRGGMGVVYRAEDRALDREVAVKVLADHGADCDASERMRREARVIARLEHPGIVPIHDLGVLADGRIFYVMKLIRGRRLDQHFDAATPLAEKLGVFERICETVAFAHAAGVVHRDLKPQNIMVGAFGEVLVLDWGVAKLVRGGAAAAESAAPGSTPHAPALNEARPDAEDPARTQTRRTRAGTVVGTPDYMSPEQARGDATVDTRSDVFALGGILHFLLHQLPPRPGTADALARRLPRRLAAIGAKAMDPNPAERYQNAEAMRRDVANYRDNLPLSAYRESVSERVTRVAWTFRVPILLVLAYLLMRVAIFWLAGQ